MIYLILAIAVIVLIGFIYQEYKTLLPLFASKSSLKVHNAELVKTLLNLDEKSFEKLFELYKAEFGQGAASYARKTYETASGTTNVEIHKSKSTSIAVIAAAVGFIVVILVLFFLVVRN